MADDGSRNGCPRSPGRRCIILSIGRTLLAKSADPLRHPPKRPPKGSASWVKMGLPGPASREQTANVDFANSIWTFDEVVQLAGADLSQSSTAYFRSPPWQDSPIRDQASARLATAARHGGSLLRTGTPPADQ